MFFLAPALPYMGAGIAGLAAAARGLGSPQGQAAIRGGLRTLNKVGDKATNFGQGVISRLFGQGPQYVANRITGTPFVPKNTGFYKNVAGPAVASNFASAYLDDSKTTGIDINSALEDDAYFSDPRNEGFLSDVKTSLGGDAQPETITGVGEQILNLFKDSEISKGKQF